MDWDKATAELRKKLDPEHIQKPDGKFGPKGDYLTGWHVISEANEIFGFGGWSYTIDMQRDDLREVEVTKTWNGQTKTELQWQSAYTCICTLTVDGVTRQDVGFGSGFAKAIGDAIEGATKEAATDALKRSLRTFGNRFGLALYDKSRKNVGVDEPPFDSAATRDRIKAAIDKCTTEAQLDGLWKHKATADAMAKLDPPHKGELSKVYDDKRASVRDDPAHQAHPMNGGRAA